MRTVGITSTDMARALEELHQKSCAEIELDTCMTWGARAMIAYGIYADTGKVQWLLDGEAYAGEAIEHSAFAGADAYSYIAEQMTLAKKNAIETRRAFHQSLR